MRKSPLYHLFTWIILIIGLLFLANLAPILYSPEFILSDDFGHFWASGKLFIENKNPYDLQLLHSVQIDAGAAPSASPGIGSQTLNPPWTLLFFAPFSLVDYSLARIAWLLLNIMLIVLSIKIFWHHQHGSDDRLWLALLVAIGFSPTYSVLAKGQITPWIVLGIAGLILYTEGKLNVWWASVCLVMISTKPQLFYLLWPALGIWVLSKRKWHLLFSGLSVAAVAITATWMINQHVFSQYFTAIQEYPYDQWATPTIGAYLRYFWLGADMFWVQYIPACLGFVWLVFHYLKYRDHWHWTDQIPLMPLISYLTSPYAWTYDAVIILPAILSATHWLTTLNRAVNITFWLIFFLLNLANLLLHTQLSDFWFLWLAPSLVLWYLAIFYKYKLRLKFST